MDLGFRRSWPTTTTGPLRRENEMNVRLTQVWRGVSIASRSKLCDVRFTITLIWLVDMPKTHQQHDVRFTLGMIWLVNIELTPHMEIQRSILQQRIQYSSSPSSCRCECSVAKCTFLLFVKRYLSGLDDVITSKGKKQNCLVDWYDLTDIKIRLTHRFSDDEKGAVLGETGRCQLFQNSTNADNRM